MKALLYQIEICDSALDWTHGHFYPIWEMWIPEAKMYVNVKNGLNVFYRHDDETEPRFKTEPRDPKTVLRRMEVSIPDQLILLLKNYIETRRNVSYLIEKIFEDATEDGENAT